jgi:hypothetical protein
MAPPQPVTVSLELKSYRLTVNERTSVVAHVIGTETPVTWTLNCDSGQASIAESGNSVVLTALAGGTCFIWAMEGQLAAGAIVQISPLRPGDPCAEDSQCSQEAPSCLASWPCGKTCTMTCTSDADCPLDAAGHQVGCRHQVCRLIRDTDWSCP